MRGVVKQLQPTYIYVNIYEWLPVDDGFYIYIYMGSFLENGWWEVSIYMYFDTWPPYFIFYLFLANFFFLFLRKEKTCLSQTRVDLHYLRRQIWFQVIFFKITLILEEEFLINLNIHKKWIFKVWPSCNQVIALTWSGVVFLALMC